MKERTILQEKGWFGRNGELWLGHNGWEQLSLGWLWSSWKAATLWWPVVRQKGLGIACRGRIYAPLCNFTRIPTSPSSLSRILVSIDNEMVTQDYYLIRVSSSWFPIVIVKMHLSATFDGFFALRQWSVGSWSAYLHRGIHLYIRNHTRAHQTKVLILIHCC